VNILSDRPEFVVCAAIKGSSHVYSEPPPLRHDDVRKANPVLGQRYGTEGFLTSYGRFVGRKEAAEIARKQGQIKKGLMEAPYLHTEDLW
jgi:hypothetical protein